MLFSTIRGAESKQLAQGACLVCGYRDLSGDWVYDSLPEWRVRDELSRPSDAPIYRGTESSKERTVSCAEGMQEQPDQSRTLLAAASGISEGLWPLSGPNDFIFP
jgi:hypothetical protein